MNIKSSKELVDEANELIKVMSPEQVKKAYDKDEITLIDVRDIRELWKEGTIKDSIHIPRGMLEFWLDPQSSYYQEKKIGDIMPKVGKKKFAYTKAGKKKAKSYAKKKGKKVKY